MNLQRPNILSIAGFDPSCGAGIPADIKTIEANNAYGVAAVSALTYQNDTEFDEVEWINYEKITRQITVLWRRLKFSVVKIGLIESVEVLHKLIMELKKLDNSIKIIWDPILKATAGYIFHENIEKEQLIDCLKNITLITPNTQELNFLLEKITIKKESLQNFIKEISGSNFLLKGGHTKNREINDLLITHDNKYVFSGKKFPKKFDKHGTGCILSSAIAANLANNQDLQTACKNAKIYIHRTILSNTTKLSYHY